jgi:predicted dehydrogenase
VTTRNIQITTATTPGKLPNPLRVAQIGLAGGIGYVHINEYAKNPHFQLLGGFDLYPQNPAVAGAITRLRESGAKIYHSFAEALADPAVEAVDICTPHHFHADMAIAAFNAGKHVLVEKPVSPFPGDVQRMIAAQKASGKVGAVQMQHLGRSSMMDLRHALQSGAIGAIKEVFLSSLWWRTEDYYGRIAWAGKMKIDSKWVLDGVLFNQSIHMIAQMQALCSPTSATLIAPMKDIRAAMYKFHDAPALETGDTAFITARFDTPDAPRVTMVATTAALQERHQIDILGATGRALWNGAGYLFPDDQPMREFHDDNREFDGTSRIFTSFAQTIRGQRPAPLTPFSELLKTSQFLYNCYQAANWNFKKAPWSATESELTQVITNCRQSRCLPADLPAGPQWSH